MCAFVTVFPFDNSTKSYYNKSTISYYIWRGDYGKYIQNAFVKLFDDGNVWIMSDAAFVIAFIIAPLFACSICGEPNGGGNRAVYLPTVAAFMTAYGNKEFSVLCLLAIFKHPPFLFSIL